MKELFLLSGLGADQRVFEFLDLSPYHITHVDWIDPLPQESIQAYAGRLLDQIHHPNPTLIGVSFGGMMAIEIAKRIRTEHVILISSAQSRLEIPLSFRWAGKLKFHHLIPNSILNEPNAVLHALFSVTGPWEKELLDQIIRDTDPKFLRWALDRIVQWDNKTQLSNIISIHGTADKMFPDAKADYSIQDGGHFMVVNRATEISSILHRIL